MKLSQEKSKKGKKRVESTWVGSWVGRWNADNRKGGLRPIL